MGEDRKRTSPEALLVLGRIGRHLDICHGYRDRQTQMPDTMRAPCANDDPAAGGG